MRVARRLIPRSLLHSPRYLRLLFGALGRPFLLFVVIMGNALWFALSYLFLSVERGVNPRVQHYGDALWWGLSTLTTVGYGDITPQTGAGRLIGGALMVTGNFFFLSVGGLLFSALAAQTEEDIQRERHITERELREVLEEIQALRREIRGMPKS
ncbi:MAG: two pore domain potassium channel family protein [Bdellovibrionales bacterium]|nr:two pore domain potassium channel family protein [Bdellovibrionales bacterium]